MTATFQFLHLSHVTLRFYIQNIRSAQKLKLNPPTKSLMCLLEQSDSVLSNLKAERTDELGPVFLLEGVWEVVLFVWEGLCKRDGRDDLTGCAYRKTRLENPGSLLAGNAGWWFRLNLDGEALMAVWWAVSDVSWPHVSALHFNK